MTLLISNTMRRCGLCCLDRGGACKLFIGVVYMPDMGKSASVRSAAYSALQEDLECLSSRGSVLVMGDFNARVGRASDPTARIGMHGKPLSMTMAACPSHCSTLSTSTH
jgi:hypothetical protein